MQSIAQPAVVPIAKVGANDPKPAGKWIERFEEWLGDGGFVNR